MAKAVIAVATAAVAVVVSLETTVGAVRGGGGGGGGVREGPLLPLGGGGGALPVAAANCDGSFHQRVEDEGLSKRGLKRLDRWIGCEGGK